MRPYILPLALLFIAFTVPSIAQNVPEVVVSAGAPLAVECEVGVQQRAEWRVQGAPPPADMRAGAERALPRGRLRVRLEAPAAAPHHAGLYSCAPGPAPPPAARVRVLRLPHDAETETTQAPGVARAGGAPGGEGEVAERTPMLYNLSSPMQFNCSAGPDVSEYQWFINGTAVSGDTKGVKLEAGGAQLTVLRAGEADFGNYTCRAGGVVAGAWEAMARPLAFLQHNTNVVEGQKFVMTCKLIGKPYEAVSWNFTTDTSAGSVGAALEVGENTRFSVRDSPAGVPGGLLEGTNATRDDAGVYTCVAPRGGVSASSTLRVKDVYAALWPFLGICLEVFILCAIILVYEKRRTKPELDDSDADAHDQKKS